MKKTVKLLAVVCAFGAATFATQAQQVERPKNLDVQQLKQAKVMPEKAVKLERPTAQVQRVVKKATPLQHTVQTQYKRNLKNLKIQDARKVRAIKE